MSVVLRCPNCGTTRATPGECEACHEARARYYCANHAPGLWLDSSACPKCGSRFGEPPRAFAPPAPVVRSARTPPATPASARPSAPLSSAVADRPAPHAEPAKVVADRSEPASVIREEDRAKLATMAPWQTILSAVLNARSAARARERLPIGVGAGGCLRRLLMIVLLLGVALVIALFLFGRALLHGLEQSY